MDKEIKNGEIFVKVRNYVPGPETLQEYSGKITGGDLHLIQDLQKFEIEESLTLSHICYSVFVYRFDSPITSGDRVWLKFILRPAIFSHEADMSLGPLRFLREELFTPCRILSPSQVRERFKELIFKAKQRGPKKVYDGTFSIESKIIKKGFDSPGTITRIRDWRISLLGNISGLFKRVRIDNINVDPDPATKFPTIISVPRTFKHPGKIDKLRYRYRNPTYDHLEWLTGYQYQWKSDFLEIIKKLCGYLWEYGNCANASKSKIHIGRALEDLPHHFCSWIVDKLKDRGWLLAISKNEEECYYIEKKFPMWDDFVNNLLPKILKDDTLIKELQIKWAEPVFLINYVVRWRNFLYPIMMWVTLVLAILALWIC